MPSPRRTVLRLLAGLALGLLVLAFWVGYRAWTVSEALTDTVASARDVRAAAGARDLEALPGLLDRLEAHSGTAVDRTGGWTWRLVGVLPLVGDDADAVSLVSEVVHDLAGSGLQAGVEAASGIDGLTPRDGRIDLDAVRALEAPTGEAAEATARAADRLATVETEDLVGPLRSRFEDLDDELADGADALAAAHTATRLLPGLLGGEGERHFLAVFQNNAEARSTGGLPGSVVELVTDDGEISLARQVPGQSFGRRATPVLPLTEGERTLYGDFLGTFFLDAGFTPDFDRAAELWSARWQERFPGPVDGVLSLDTVALSYLVGALSSPVEVDGVQLTEDTLVDELLHRTYLRLQDPAAQDRFFGQVSAAVFDRVRSGDLDPETLLSALSRATAEGRLQFSSTDAQVQDELAGTRLAGPSLDGGEGDAPSVVVTFDDKGADKMTYFLRATTRLQPRYCVDGRQAFELVLRLSSVAPPDAADLPDYVTGRGSSVNEPGQLAVTVRVYLPEGGTLGEVQVGGQPLDADAQQLGGRTVSSTSVRLDPGGVTDLSWRMLGAPGETAAHDLWVTPTLGSKALGAVAPAC